MRTPIVTFASLFILSLTGHAHAAPLLSGAPVPELDPQAGGAALVLLAGAIAILSSRRRARTAH